MGQKILETSPILKVAVLDDGRTAIFPKSQKAMYQYMYRAAAGVYWDQKRKCFVSTPPKEWLPPQWYQHMVAIVRSELGLQMILTPGTVYESTLDGFEESIKQADQELHKR